jgi:hypothetical protein
VQIEIKAKADRESKNGEKDHKELKTVKVESHREKDE